MCNSDKTTVCQQCLRDANLSMNIECLIEANFCPIQWLTPLVSTWLINSCRHLSSCLSAPANLTCPVAALKHSPSKRTKSVKSKPSNASGQASGASGSGQDSGAPPSKEGKLRHTLVPRSLLVTLSLAIRHPGIQVQVKRHCRRDLRDGKGFSWVHWVRGRSLAHPAPPVRPPRRPPWSAGGGAARPGSSAPCAPSLPAAPCGGLLLLYL